MRIDILSAVPALLESPFAHSMVKIAQEKGLVTIKVHDLRDYSKDKHRKIDDYAFGGGAGMVMTIQPIADCIEQLKSERDYDEVIYMTPDGEQLTQSVSNKMSSFENIIILCGHYKGVDQRVRDLYVTKEITVGDFVLSGGELAAAILVDSIVRLIPGVLGDEMSALSDSFQDNLLAPPVYTRPADYNGLKVPEILLSGHSQKTEDWRLEESIKRTKERRPDLLSDDEE